MSDSSPSDNVGPSLKDTPLPSGKLGAAHTLISVATRVCYLVAALVFANWLDSDAGERSPLYVGLVVSALVLLELFLEWLRRTKDHSPFLTKAEAGAAFYALMPDDIRPFLRGHPWENPEQGGWGHLHGLAADGKLTLYAKWGPTTVVEPLSDARLASWSVFEQVFGEDKSIDRPRRVLVKRADLKRLAKDYVRELRDGGAS